MQRPFIFIATGDQDFERIALEAIMDTSHGMRRAGDLRAACHFLSSEKEDIALAIIDLDLRKRAHALLSILSGSEPGIPILVVANDPSLLENDDMAAQLTTQGLVKPVSVTELKQKIQDLCLPSAQVAADQPFESNEQSAPSSLSAHASNLLPA